MNTVMLNSTLVDGVVVKGGSGEGGGAGVAAVMTEITWADLVALRDSEKLVAGTKYRIIDYETTSGDPETQVAGHPFDVIVTALDSKTLDEKASAIWSARDTDGYFANSDLNAWDVRYCLDNDASRFGWASTNGFGVIYRLADEHSNSCPYDFKNIKFVRNGTYYFTFYSSNEDATITAYDRFYNNYLNEGCWNNVFNGLKCCNNILGSYCTSNTFSMMADTTFGSYCCSNTFGSSDSTFGNKCSNILANTLNCCTFGHNCNNLVFQSDTMYGPTNTSCDYVNIGTNCAYLKLYTSGTYDPLNIKHMNVEMGIQGTADSVKAVFITDPYGTDCVYWVSRNSVGDIAVYCPTDLYLSPSDENI